MVGQSEVPDAGTSYVHIINQQRMPSLHVVEVRWSIAKGKIHVGLQVMQ